MSPIHGLQLLILAALWGSSFLFMRISAAEVAPLVITLARAGIAAVFLCTLLLLKGQFRYVFRRWKPLTIVGLANTAIPFSLFAYAAIYLEAGYASILNATAPMFTAITAYIWLGIRLPKLGLIGLIIGFAGVFFLVFNKLEADSQLPILPILATLLATIHYGVAANVTKKYLYDIPSLAVATGSIFFAAVTILPLAYFQLPTTPISHQVWLSLLVLGIGCTAIPLMIYFNLLNQIGVNKTVSVTYLIPIFGVIWGMIFLNETLSHSMFLGALLILLGVSLTTGVIKPKQAKVSSAQK